MTRANMLNAIWRDTHPDYKCRVGGVRHILVLRDDYGTCLVRLDSLTNAEVAVAFERKQAAKAALRKRLNLPSGCNA